MKHILPVLLTVLTLHTSPASGEKIVCYYTSWAHYRAGVAKYTVDHLPVELCTHAVYAFAVLDAKTLTIVEHDDHLDNSSGLDNYRRFIRLRERRPGIKLLLALGGWTDSRSDKYSRLVSEPQRRAAFVSHVVSFLQEYGFDGLDLDWEYPGYQSSPQDREGFRLWVEELRAAFSPRGLLLTAAVSARKSVIDQGYDVPAVAKALDQIHLMSYDFHGSWERRVAHHAPLFPAPGQEKELSADFAVRHWIKRGAPASKLVLGVPFYGRSWTLAGADASSGAPASGAGRPGPLLKTSGMMSFYEICLAHVRYGWPKVQHRDGPHLTLMDQWVAYDDVDEVVKKAQYSRRLGLAGVMVWDTSMDDFQGLCGAGRNPLLAAISRTLMGGQGPSFPARPEVNTLTSTPPMPLVESSSQTTVTTSSTIITNTSPSTAAATHDIIIFPTTPPGLLETSTVSKPEHSPVSINITECKAVGYTPDPQSCFHFYRCDHTRAFRFSCPAGLHWYQDLLLCNWPSLGSCQVSVVSFIRSRFILPEDEDDVIADEATGAIGYFSHFI
ncbi:chitotriosidase-1-like [Penaeus chinensis]|uniref:chitotriosidase-1-like n=1 Tax=Penaeus chinensis TaxID=139456 RepID=UPI001FB69161|nr:chitotriosidase-1-like [Penaeus chinensis]